MSEAVVATIERANAYWYRMPLKRAYGTARGQTTTAQNFAVHLVLKFGDKYFDGFGECQPRHALTGDGGKNREKAWEFLGLSLDHLIGTTLEVTDREAAVQAVRDAMAPVADLAVTHAASGQEDKPFRGTQLGVEVALLDATAQALDLRLSELLGEHRQDVEISISTISTTADLSDIPRRAARQTRFPITRVKGKGGVEENVALLRAVNEGNLGASGEKPIWVDLNESMNFDEATAFLEAVAAEIGSGALPERIIVEGPLPHADGDLHAELQKRADAALAAHSGTRAGVIEVMPDESMWDTADLQRLNALGGARALNIKAPKAGGLLASLDLANAAVQANPDVRLCIGGMLGTSELTAWALHNLGRALPRVDYMTTVPPTNVEAAIASPKSRYVEKGSNTIARQTQTGLGAKLDLQALAPYIVKELTRGSTGGTRVPASDDRRTLTGLAQLLEGTWVGEVPGGLNYTGATFLAERVRPGQVLIAMDSKGWGSTLRKKAKQDRPLEDIARRAQALGASAIVSSQGIETPGLPSLKVNDTRQALWTMGREMRNVYPGHVVGITGTAGKTTVKTMVSHALRRSMKVDSSSANWNSIDGVGLLLAGLDQSTDAAVLEISGAGFVRIPGVSSARLAAPDVAVVTSIGAAHADIHDTLEATASLKAKIFEGLAPGGTAVINADAPHADVLMQAAHAQGARLLTYGEADDCDIRLLDYSAATQTATANVLGTEIEYRVGAPGRFNAVNSLVVAGVAIGLGQDPAELLGRLADFAEPQGRGTVHNVNWEQSSLTIVDQSYNANPLSMAATLEAFTEQYAEQRRILVLGDMKELGDDSADLHESLKDAVTKSDPGFVLVVGELMEHLWKALPAGVKSSYCREVDDVLPILRSEVQDNDAVFFKASHSVGLETVIQRIQKESEDSTPKKLSAPQTTSRTKGAPKSQVSQLETWRMVIEGSAVQGVGLRRWVKDRAERENLNGWVRNRSDGSVEALIRGNSKAVRAMTTAVQSGPKAARVDSVSLSRSDVVPRAGFRLRANAQINEGTEPNDRKPIGRQVRARVGSLLRKVRGDE